MSPPERVRVTRPDRPRRTPRRTAASEIDAQSDVGLIYLASLMRSQLRLALAVVLVLVISVGGLPLLFTAFPGLTAHEFLGMPVTWIVLGFGVYPWLVFVAWRYVRLSERNERSFADVVERP